MVFWDFFKPKQDDCSIKLNQANLDYSALKKQLDAVNNAKNRYSELLQDCSKSKNNLLLENTSLVSKIKELENSLEKENNPKEKELNNKYPKANITYKRRETDNWYEIDVKNFLSFQKDFSLPIISGSSDDEKALNCLKWIISNIRYKPDLDKYGYDEYWAMPWQTQINRVGDCECGSILLHNIMLHNDIPYWKIRLTAGDVTIKDGVFGHCYNTYFCEETNDWKSLDWCFKPNTLPINQRVNYKDESVYYGVWWSTNREYSFYKGVNQTGLANTRFYSKFKINSLK